MILILSEQLCLKIKEESNGGNVWSCSVASICIYSHTHTHLREVKILKRITDSNNQEQQWLFPCFSKQTKWRVNSRPKLGPLTTSSRTSCDFFASQSYLTRIKVTWERRKEKGGELLSWAINIFHLAISSSEYWRALEIVLTHCHLPVCSRDSSQWLSLSSDFSVGDFVHFYNSTQN